MSKPKSNQYVVRVRGKMSIIGGRQVQWVKADHPAGGAKDVTFTDDMKMARSTNRHTAARTVKKLRSSGVDAIMEGVGHE